MSSNRDLLNLLVQTTTKAKGKGGFGGFLGKLGYTMPGKGVRSVKKPGSRGGHFYTDANGKVHYGAPPKGRSSSGTKPKPATAHARTTGVRPKTAPKPKAAPKPRTAHNAPGNFKRQTPQSKLTNQRKILRSLNNSFRTGVDPHGNPLSESSLAQINALRGSLRSQIRAATPPKAKEVAVKAESKGDAKIAKVMGEFKKGALNTGSPKGPKVTNPKQAIAIALSQARKVSKSKKKETDPGGSFTVFKDKQGAWRWVAVSSSGFQDRDGETVSTKALAQNVALHDALGNYGPLKLGPIDWWHTPAVIGDCDFSAMHGKMLVESGTFKSPVVAQRIAEKIANKEFNPSISIEFTHNEPGPQPLPGRVYNQIHIVRRALLPAEVASNIASTFQVVNPASSGLITKEVKKQTMDAHKEKRLRELLGDNLTDEFLNGTERSEKAIELAGVAFKAAAALDAPMDKSPVNAAPVAPAGDTKVAKKDDVLDAAPVEGMTEDMGEEPGGDYEDSPTDEEADAIMETLFNRIGQIVTETVKTKVDEILSAVNGLGSASTKEIAAMEGIGIALKENATALTKVTGENTALKERVATLESKLAALDGTQPAAVRARASQAQGLKLEQLHPALQQLVNKEANGQNPYEGDYAMQMAAQMTNSISQRWQQ